MGYSSDISGIIESFCYRITQASRLMELGQFNEAISELEKIQREAWQYNIPQISALVEKSLKEAQIFKNLVQIFRVSRKIKIDDVCEQLESPRKEFLKIFIERGEKFGMYLDGDFISIINADNLEKKMRESIISENSKFQSSAILKKYKMFISLGDSAFEKKDYKKASEQYSMAINIAKNELFESDLVLQAEKLLEENQKMLENIEFVKNGENAFNKTEYEKSIVFFNQSKELCENYRWQDGIRYANEMIEKCNQKFNEQPISYYGIMLERSEYNFMMELEKIIDRPIPNIYENKISYDTFGFFALNNHVVGLGIYDSNLSSLPESIDSLTALKELNLAGNQLSNLPENICLLKILKELWLHDNQLSSLPQSIGSLVSLQVLSLHDNQLSSLPQNIGSLESIQGLSLHGNQLSSLPKSIGSLTSLKELSFDGDLLFSLPESISSLKSLEELYVFDYQFSSLPERISSFKSLREIELDENQLSALPETVKKWFKNLKKIGCRIRIYQ